MGLQTSQVIKGRYRIVKRIATGGYGAVYRAWDLNLRTPCAIKENLNIQDASRDQFDREAKILAGLSHPNLPRVTDSFLIPGQGQYLVMDYVEGKDLQELLEERGGALELDLVIKWATQVCDALDYLHTQAPPVIHRDIKPANIKITPHGDAMLVDFGIAKLFDLKRKTFVGAQAVTGGYSPPEQYGQGGTDAQSDIYALGATIYTLLTGVIPPDSITLLSGGIAPLAPVRQYNPAIPENVDAAIQRAMQLEKSNRYPNARSFQKALNQPIQAAAYGETILVTPAVAQEASPAEVKKSVHWGIWIMGALFILSLLVLGIWAGSGFLADRRLDNWRTQTAEAVAVKLEVTKAPTEERVVETVESVAPSATPPASITTAPTETPTITPTAVPVLGIGSRMVSETDEMVMVYVPAGEFTMGWDGEGGLPNESPEHVVYLDAFWIDQTEVSNAKYQKCVNDGGCDALAENVIPSYPSVLRYYDAPEFADAPVIYINWQQGADYCSWAGRRLPTEAEWEKAARGEDLRIYPWGSGEPGCGSAHYWAYDYYDDYDERYGGAIGCGGHPADVGSLPDGASVYGALDMIGNVGEWVADWYASDYYRGSSKENPTGPNSGDYHVYRGGLGYYYQVQVPWFSVSGHLYNYSDFVFTLRLTVRNYATPRYRTLNLGFRCAQTP